MDIDVVSSMLQDAENSNLTVEEYLVQYAEKLKQIIQNKNDQAIDEFKTTWENTLKELSQEVIDASTEESNVSFSVNFQVEGGDNPSPYDGSSWTVTPTLSAPICIGRSSGTKFIKEGISLSKDEEVSTNHAKLEIKNEAVYLTDLGSTNGTYVNGEVLDEKIPVKLENKSKVKIGRTVFIVSLERQINC